MQHQWIVQCFLIYTHKVRYKMFIHRREIRLLKEYKCLLLILKFMTCWSQEMKGEVNGLVGVLWYLRWWRKAEGIGFDGWEKRSDIHWRYFKAFCLRSEFIALFMCALRIRVSLLKQTVGYGAELFNWWKIVYHSFYFFLVFHRKFCVEPGAQRPVLVICCLNLWGLISGPSLAPCHHKLNN